MILGWLRRRRRRCLLAQPFPEAWRNHVGKNVRHWNHLSSAEQGRLLDATAIIVAEKTWVGCRGLAITDEIKVTVAAQAALLLLGWPPRYYFDDVLSVLVYPDLFVTDQHGTTLGEAWEEGPVILSWRHVKDGARDPRDGLNLVLHEFAHQLDDAYGGMSGTPPLRGRHRFRRWREVAEREYLRLVNRAERGEATLLDHYGASDRAEFFAVSTECFFERPLEMRRRHPELYEIFGDFYGQDPARWFPDPAAGRPDVCLGGCDDGEIDDDPVQEIE